MRLLASLWTNPVRCLHLSAFLAQLRVARRAVCTSSDYNPLFSQDSLPKFESIAAHHVAPGMLQLIQDFRNDFHQYEEKLTRKR